MFRRAIMAAAAEVFVDKGFHATRIHDIAERARIGVGTVYNHFEQKEDVLLALLEEHMAALADRFAAAQGDPRSFAGRLEARLARVLAYKEEHRAFFALAMDYGLLGPTQGASSLVLKGRKVKSVERLRRELLSFAEQGVREGALRADVSAAAHVRLLGGVMRALSAEGEPSSSRAPLVVDLFLRGAHARERHA